MAGQITALQVRRLADKSEGSRVTMLAFPPEALETLENGAVVVKDPSAAQQRLVNPDTPGFDHEAWPTLGWDFIGAAPKRTRVGTAQARVWQQEGFLTLEGETVVHRPAGPPEDLWKGAPHTFIHADAFVFHTVDGDVRYRVSENPDKQHPNRYAEDGSVEGGEVWHYYTLELEG